MNNRDLRQEIIEPTDERVAGLLSRLPKAEPPSDFDIRVRAAIARRKSDERARSRWSWQPIATLSSIALLAAIWGGVTYFSVGTQESAVATNLSNVAAPAPPNVRDEVALNPNTDIDIVESPNESAVAADSTGQINITAVSNSNTRVNSNTTAARTDRAPIRNTSVVRPTSPEANEGGSFDEAVTAADRLDTSSSDEKKISSMDLLRRAGVSGSMSGGQYLVTSASGAAAAAGLRVGDVVLAVNGSAISSVDSFNQNVRLRSITIQRDGSRLVLNISR